MPVFKTFSSYLLYVILEVKTILNRKSTLLTFSLIGLVIIVLFLVTGTGSADSPSAGPVEAPLPQAGVDDRDCLVCHELPDQYLELPSGERLYLTVDPEEYYSSVHGSQGYACVQCHRDIREYPHPPLAANTLRDVTLQLNQSCSHCHEGMANETLDSVHARALAAGNDEAAVCSDCHGAHNVQNPHEPLSRSAKMCERCHSIIFNQYRVSVHGSALIGEGNPDVPSCIDCHGVHNIQGPSTEPFRLYSPLICAECHADEELMTEYGISTDVFDTYVSDFHGTTTVLFDQRHPDQETNKAVCIDCHGVHDIRRADDPDSAVYKDNLLITCQRCHPDATTNFPTSWLGHYRPDPNKFPIVYFVDLFYRIFIPVVLGGMAVFVVTDAARRIINYRKERSHAES
jgi:hypothetical protein